MHEIDHLWWIGALFPTWVISGTEASAWARAGYRNMAGIIRMALILWFQSKVIVKKIVLLYVDKGGRIQVSFRKVSNTRLSEDVSFSRMCLGLKLAIRSDSTELSGLCHVFYCIWMLMTCDRESIPNGFLTLKLFNDMLPHAAPRG
jgi:hypothetical protein